MLPPSDTEKILDTRFGQPLNLVSRGMWTGERNKKVSGYKTASGRVLALNRASQMTHIWFQPPMPPEIKGCELRERPAINADLNGDLKVLNNRKGLQVEVKTRAALNAFLDWYDSSTSSDQMEAAFREFSDLLDLKSGEGFVSFRQGLPAVWESYKPKLRDHALTLLDAGSWDETTIGSGNILGHVVSAIEIRDASLNNNLLTWDGRYGPDSRDHAALIDATASKRSLLENLFFKLYRGDGDVGGLFDAIAAQTGYKYPMMAYLFFLKDSHTYMPIQPTGFDRVFAAFGIELRTLRQCSWENYSAFNSALQDLRPKISQHFNVTDVALIDAHSLCWIYSTLLKERQDGGLSSSHRGKDPGRILGPRQTSIAAMIYSVRDTVRNSNGQMREARVKNKELRMSEAELEVLLNELLDIQDGLCRLTGLPLQLIEDGADPDFAPSLDRIDSNRHYEYGNLQIVCRFANFWKGSTNNERFLRLLAAVRNSEPPLGLE